MGKVMPVALLLALTLCTLRVNAEDEPQIITPEGLATSQMLPSLDGAVADLPLSAAAPGNLMLNDAVSRAVSWHPSIRESIGKLLSQNEQIDVAKSKYYPQVSAGMNNGYSNTYTDHGFSRRWLFRCHKCCTTSAKWQARSAPRQPEPHNSRRMCYSVLIPSPTQPPTR